jgi:LAO/AO transport system kinase
MEDKNHRKTRRKATLNMQDGVPQPPSIHREAFDLIRRKKKRKLQAREYVEGIIEGRPLILSRAITILESTLASDQLLAEEIIDQCLPHSGNSLRIGITGVPGVGKSTFIEEFGHRIIESGRKLAVLAIDPSSKRSGGSIMGDKTRMEKLSGNPGAFIRPSPSAGSLGGVARKTRETITLCEAAGFDTIFIETVGVGQSETAVYSMVDFFLLLMLPGSGDELQGIKRGIVEMADAIAITKADGDNLRNAEQARSEFSNALHYYPPAESGWTPKVMTCSAFKKEGLEQIWDMIQDYFRFVKDQSWFEKNRKKQSTYWMHQTIEEGLKNYFYNQTSIKEKITALEKEVQMDQISAFKAAREILAEFRKTGDPEQKSP